MVWCIHMHTWVNMHACVCVCARVADSGSRLEIKTLCGTELVIELELKQKAEEHGVKKKKKWGEEKEMARAAGGGEVYCLRREEVSDCHHCSTTARLGCFLSECQADLSH